jgi:GNAT superfamily N-acetyltransferase
MATAERRSIYIDPATPADVPDILRFIRGLAEYEKLAHACVATEDALLATLFGKRPAAEVLIARLDGTPVGFALFFSTYSTFRAKPGMYLEDLFVLAEHRGRGVGKALLVRLAQLARERDCGRLEWSVLDWNTPAIEFYQRVGATVMRDWQLCRMTPSEIAKLAGEDK